MVIYILNGIYPSPHAYVSTPGVGADTPGKCTVEDCKAVVKLVTLGGVSVGGMQVFGVGGMQSLIRFPRYLIFGLGRGKTEVNWDGSYHILNISRSYVISLNCASQLILGAYFRSQESMFIPCRILSARVSVGCVSQW